MGTKGFCQVKKNQKIREKLGSGWVGQAPTFLPKKLKKLDRRVGGWCLANPSFSLDFLNFFNLTKPLTCSYCDVTKLILFKHRPTS